MQHNTNNILVFVVHVSLLAIKQIFVQLCKQYPKLMDIPGNKLCHFHEQLQLLP